jgi:hypothetical protein
MKRIPKIAAVTTGVVIALWMMVYWDVRQADMVCDNAQAPDQICQERFIELDRLKRILKTNERKRAQ